MIRKKFLFVSTIASYLISLCFMPEGSPISEHEIRLKPNSAITLSISTAVDEVLLLLQISILMRISDEASPSSVTS